MKTLLIILISFISLNIYCKNQDSILYIDKSIIILLNEYEIYKQECYNDSIAEEIYRYLSDDEIDLIINIHKSFYDTCNCSIFPYIKDTIYHHNHIPTFEGFIEYLNKKYK